MVTSWSLLHSVVWNFPSGPAPPPDCGSLEQNRAGRGSPKPELCAKRWLRLSHLTDTCPGESTLLGSLLHRLGG